MEWTAQRKSETKVKTRVSRKEAAAEIEAGGRRKEIADDRTVSTEKSRPFLFLLLKKSLHPGGGGIFYVKRYHFSK